MGPWYRVVVGADVSLLTLGHAKLETTQIYTQVSIRKLKEIHTATHPGARMARNADDRASLITLDRGASLAC